MLLYCKGQTYCPLSLENLGGTKILSSLFDILIVPGWGSASLRLIVSYWSVHGILKHSHVSAVRVIIVCSHFRLSDLHYAPFIWSLSPKTTLPPSYPIHKVTCLLIIFLCKIQPTVYKRIVNPSRGRDIFYVRGQVVAPQQVG